MPINSSIVIHSIVFALGLVTGAGSIYVLGAEWDSRPWILWEHSNSVLFSVPSAREEWKMIAAGRNRADCKKRLAKLADDLRKGEKKVVMVLMGIRLLRVPLHLTELLLRK